MSSGAVPLFARGGQLPISYNRNMIHPATNRVPQHDWYLQQWCDYHRIDQAELRRRCGWSKRKASMLFSGEQRFNRDTLNEAAWALNAHPFELLMDPHVAHDYRSMRVTVEHVAARLAADNREAFGENSIPDDDADRITKAAS